MANPWDRPTTQGNPWDRPADAAPKPLTGVVGNASDSGVPAALQGGPEPEYKPFFSADAALAQGSGVLKAGAVPLSVIAHAVNRIPGAMSDADRQGMEDNDRYIQAANKDEQFGKVAGVLGGVGALAAPIAAAASPVVSTAIPVLGAIASSPLGRYAGMRAAEEGSHALWNKLKNAF
jgi:hypothetical protein